MRDRADAELFAGLDVPGRFDKLVAICSGTKANFVVVVLGLVGALGATLGGAWSMPAEVADRLEKGESIRFVFDKPGFRITTFALTQGDVKADGRAYVKKGLEPKLQRAPGPKRGPRARTYRSKRKQPAPAVAAPKPAPKKPAKKPAKKRTFTWD